VALFEKDRRAGQIARVIVAVDAERLREFAGAVREVAIAGHATGYTHPVDAFDGLDRPNEDSTSDALPLRDDIEEPVTSVNQIHIRGRRRLEKIGGAAVISEFSRLWIKEAPAVKRRIVLRVRLCLDNPSDARRSVRVPTNQVPTEQVTGHLQRITCKE